VRQLIRFGSSTLRRLSAVFDESAVGLRQADKVFIFAGVIISFIADINEDRSVELAQPPSETANKSAAIPLHALARLV
jgi:hypothetical protein